MAPFCNARFATIVECSLSKLNLDQLTAKCDYASLPFLLFLVKQQQAAARFFDKCFSTRAAARMAVSRETVDKLIASDKVVIFSKTTCPFCKMAKEAFDKLKQAYTAIELDKREDGDAIFDILEEITGARTVPRVFIKGEFIGGGTDVKKMLASGELEKKLA